MKYVRDTESRVYRVCYAANPDGSHINTHIHRPKHTNTHLNTKYKEN